MNPFIYTGIDGKLYQVIPGAYDPVVKRFMHGIVTKLLLGTNKEIV